MGLDIIELIDKFHTCFISDGTLLEAMKPFMYRVLDFIGFLLTLL